MNHPRDTRIDLLRGLAALGIVFHHTITWTCVSFTSNLFYTLSMLIEVPVFFLISGMTFHYRKKASGVVLGACKLYVQYGLFVLLLEAINFICKPPLDPTVNYPKLCLREAVSMMLFRWNNPMYKSYFRWIIDPSCPFQAAFASMWYIPVYLCIILIGGLFILLLKKICSNESLPYWILAGAGLVICLLLFANPSLITDDFWRRVLFHGVQFLIGYLCVKFALSWKQFLIGECAVIALLFGTLWYYSGAFELIYAEKNTRSIIYFTFALLGIFLYCYLKDVKALEGKGKLLIYLGTHSLQFYFAQGMIVSILIPYISGWGLPIFSKVVIALLFNLTGTLCLGFLFIQLNRPVDFIFSQISKRFFSKKNVSVS